MRRGLSIVMLCALGGAVALAGVSARAQGGPPNALQGFSQNRGQPVKIDAATLEVRDKKKIATFSGKVQVIQGDTTLRCKTLHVFYDQDGAEKSSTASLTQAGGEQRIRRLEAKGDVIVTQKDQVATGDTGIYDMPSNSVTLSGNVVVTQGPNVIKGERLVVDLTSGVSRVESGSTAQGGRVQGLFLPSSAKSEKAAPGAAQQDAAKDATGAAAKPRAMHPGLY